MSTARRVTGLGGPAVWLVPRAIRDTTTRCHTESTTPSGEDGPGTTCEASASNHDPTRSLVVHFKGHLMLVTMVGTDNDLARAEDIVRIASTKL
jgi:hypothetical protein